MADYRWTGIFPLAFGLWTSVIYLSKDQGYQLLWFCNVNNFLLAYALFTRNKLLVWVSTIWLVIGTPLWLYEDMLKQEFRLHALFVHIGSSLAGLWFMRKNPGRPKHVALAAALMGAASQLSARFFTAPEHNVNMAHFVYPTLTEVFPSYWMYNTFNFVSFFFLILLLERALPKVAGIRSQ